MRVELQLDPDAARELHRSDAAPADAASGARSQADAIRQAARELGVTVAPMHPGQTHELLAPFFYVEATDQAAAERVASRLRQVPGVAGAWVRPSDEQP